LYGDKDMFRTQIRVILIGLDVVLILLFLLVCFLYPVASISKNEEIVKNDNSQQIKRKYIRQKPSINKKNNSVIYLTFEDDPNAITASKLLRIYRR
jgi:Na+-transporting methylmalonyl-CoA/oxaloacetate decarboxylase gamma subunit